MKLPGSRSTEILAPHDSAASVTGSGLMTALSGANYGARSDGNEAWWWQGFGVWGSVAGSGIAGQAPRHWRSGIGLGTGSTVRAQQRVGVYGRCQDDEVCIWVVWVVGALSTGGLEVRIEDRAKY